MGVHADDVYAGPTDASYGHSRAQRHQHPVPYSLKFANARPPGHAHTPANTHTGCRLHSLAVVRFAPARRNGRACGRSRAL